MITALALLIVVIFLDIVLSGDNAVVIAMVANTLPDSQKNRAIFFGMVLAAAARIFFSLFALWLLDYRIISILGGAALLVIAWTLARDIWYKDDTSKKLKPARSFWHAIGLIALADISMSLDNVLAVAGAAQHNPVVLVIGLIVSIGCLAWGAKLMTVWLERWHWLNWLGVGLIALIGLELLFGFKAV